MCQNALWGQKIDFAYCVRCDSIATINLLTRRTAVSLRIALDAAGYFRLLCLVSSGKKLYFIFYKGINGIAFCFLRGSAILTLLMCVLYGYDGGKDAVQD